MTIGKNIKKLREKYGLSQKDLALVAGVSDKAVSTWENDLKEPRMGTIQKIADHFGLQKSNLIEDDGLNAVIPSQQLNKRDTKEISQIIEDTRQRLLTEPGLMFDGTPASDESIQSILDAMQVGMEMAKLRNKEKYTPKKFRK